MRKIDLNLLPVLLALIEEQSVTAAGQRVHLSQSATSSALRRIRDALNDPILVPDGKRMQLSPKARMIRQELSDNLASITKMLNNFTSDDEDNLERIAISAPEHIFVAMPGLLRRVLNYRDEKFRMVLTGFRQRSTCEELRQGEVDLALSSFGYIDANFERQTLYTDGVHVTMRKGHPAIASQKHGRITLEALEEYHHVSLSNDGSEKGSMVARLFRKRGITRRVEVYIASILNLPTVLQNSDLICVSNNRGALNNKELADFVCLMPPKELGCDTFDVEMVWRRDRRDDPALVKIRRLMMEAAEDMPPISEVSEAVLDSPGNL